MTDNATKDRLYAKEQARVVRLQAGKDEPPELTELDKDIIGRSVRFEIPIADAQLYELERIADVLIGMGNNMKFQAQRIRDKHDSVGEKEIKFLVSRDVSSARIRIRELAPGHWNGNGTVKR
jgi:hypothetical protein